MNKKIQTVTIERTYSRKINTEKQYENLDLSSRYSAVLEKPTEKEMADISEWLYKKAEEEVELQVAIRQNPGRVVRGWASIDELKSIVKAQTKKLTEAENEIEKLKLIIKDGEKPF